MELTATVRASAAVYAPMIRLGLPAALEPRAEALDRLVRSGRLGCWEWSEGELRLYLERLEAGEARTLAVPCVAIAAGTSRGLPGTAYPYYEPERRCWQPGPVLTVTP